MKHPLALPSMVLLSGLALAGCKPGAGGTTVAPGAGTPDAAAQASAPAAEGTAAAPGAGSPAAPHEMSLLEKGRRRTVGIKEAAAGVTFALQEPKKLPKDSVRSVVHLIEKIQGIDNPALPAVRQIYDLAGGGTLIVVQSMARGDLGGEVNLRVGESDAHLGAFGEQRVLIYEKDGVQVELRSNLLTAQQLQDVALSLGPVDLAAADKAPSSSEDLGAVLSGAEGTVAVQGTAAAATAPPAAGGTPKP